MRIPWVALALGAIQPVFPQAIPQSGDWPAYGRDPGGIRYSPLDRINTKNVATLQRAWTAGICPGSAEGGVPGAVVCVCFRGASGVPFAIEGE